MSHPFIVFGVNVRQLRMAFRVRVNSVLGRRGVLVSTLRGSRPGGGRGRGTPRGDMPTANAGMTATVLFALASSLLRKSR